MANQPRLKDLLPQLTERIVASYREVSALEHLVESSFPSYRAVIDIAQDLKEILFPGYQSRQNRRSGSMADHVGGLVDSVGERLVKQITRALQCRNKQRHGLHCGELLDIGAAAQTKTLQFLETLPRLRTVIATDAQAALDGDPAASGIEEVLLCYPGHEAVTIYRLAHELRLLDVPLIPRMLTEWAHSRTGIDINPGAQIGSSFFIDHGTGVVIGETCEIADHVKLYQGVTLGALSFPKDEEGHIIRGRKRHPTIRENVVIYANATVLGGNTVVGAGAVIGASVSLTQSVAPNTLVTLDKPSLRFREAS